MRRGAAAPLRRTVGCMDIPIPYASTPVALYDGGLTAMFRWIVKTPAAILVVALVALFLWWVIRRWIRAGIALVASLVATTALLGGFHGLTGLAGPGVGTPNFPWQQRTSTAQEYSVDNVALQTLLYRRAVATYGLSMGAEQFRQHCTFRRTGTSGTAHGDPVTLHVDLFCNGKRVAPPTK